MDPELFQARILGWFDQYGRKNLPWQTEPAPYRILVSEIMLQQTQVKTVIPYYERFIQQFPDVKTLAQSSIDNVLQLWAGLGYYARARNLHKAAKLISNQGKFPDTLDDLMQLPGIGRSTAGAILATAFNQRQPILDGNVKRVLTRVHAIEGWPGKHQISRKLWQLSDQFTPDKRVAEYTQAMMDLGAILCTRSKPDCPACPVKNGCLARLEARTADFPFPKPKKILPVKQTVLLILANGENEILLQQRPPVGIWGGLWSLPEFSQINDALLWCRQYDMQIIKQQALSRQRHTFSHFHLDYTPIRVLVKNPANNVLEGNQTVWYKAEQIKKLGLPAPVKRLLNQEIALDSYKTH